MSKSIIGMGAEERFWSKVDRSGPCWLWTDSVNANGYGQIGAGGRKGFKMFLTHRVAWELTNGAIPEGLFVLHKCDNPPCCNPSHLFLGTQTDNQRDMASKGRQVFQRNPGLAPRGERNGKAVLNDDLVRSIRARSKAGETGRSISRSTGLGQSHISQILRRITWGHVDD